MNFEKFTPHNGYEWAALAVMVAFIVGVGSVDVWLARGAARYIQATHPNAWSALGVKSPHTIRFMLFVRNKDYLELNDPKLNRMFEFKRRFDNGTGFLFIATMGLLILFMK